MNKPFVLSPAVQAAVEANKPPNFRLLYDNDLEDLQATEWVVKDVIPQGSVGTIFGPSGTFKSFHALDLMAHVCNGWPWMGKRVKKKKCVYVPFEGRGGIPKRVAAWRLARIKKYGITPDDSGNLGISFNIDFSTGIAFLMDPINLRHKEDQDRLIRTLTDAGFARSLICIDTLAQASAGLDENTSQMQEMIAIFQRLQHELKCEVLIVHHMGKDETKGGRGWSGIRGAMDFQIQCQRSDPAMKDGTLFLEKVKDGEDGVPLSVFAMEVVLLGFDDDGDPISSLVVVSPHDATTLPEPAQDHAETILRLIGDYYQREQYLSTSFASNATTGVYATLKGDPNFPRGLTLDKTNDILRRLQREGKLKVASYKRANRSNAECWKVEP